MSGDIASRSGEILHTFVWYEGEGEGHKLEFKECQFDFHSLFFITGVMDVNQFFVA